MNPNKLYAIINTQTRLLALEAIQGAGGVGARDASGRTPLHLAAIHGRHDIAESLIGMGAPVLVRDDDGRTPLHLSAVRDHLNCVRIFLEKGIAIDDTDREGWTSFHLALQLNKKDVCLHLLGEGAAITPQVKGVSSFLDVVSEQHSVLVRNIFHHLNKRGTPWLFDPNHIVEIVKEGQIDIAMEMIRAGADPNSINDDGLSVLLAFPVEQFTPGYTCSKIRKFIGLGADPLGLNQTGQGLIDLVASLPKASRLKVENIVLTEVAARRRTELMNQVISTRGVEEEITTVPQL